MNTRPIYVVALLIAGCSPQSEQACKEKIEKLDALRRHTHADLMRQQAECPAVAHEFNGDQVMIDNCLATYRAMVDMANSTYATIDKRMAEPDMVRCAEIAKKKYVPEMDVLGIRGPQPLKE